MGIFHICVPPGPLRSCWRCACCAVLSAAAAAPKRVRFGFHGTRILEDIGDVGWAIEPGCGFQIVTVQYIYIASVDCAFTDAHISSICCQMSDMSTSNVRNIQQSVDPLLHKPLLLPETKLPENVTKLDDNMSFGKFRMEVIEGDIFPFAPKHAGDQVITIPSKRDCSQHDLFTRWKNKLQKILHQTRDFEFSFCEADSNVVSSFSR